MKVDWTESAIADLEAIRNYIARNSEYYAARMVANILKAARVLGTFPELGQVVPELDLPTVRQKRLDNYRILYEIQKNRVVVIAVVHAARDINAVTLPDRN